MDEERRRKERRKQIEGDASLGSVWRYGGPIGPEEIDTVYENGKLWRINRDQAEWLLTRAEQLGYDVRDILNPGGIDDSIKDSYGHDTGYRPTFKAGLYWPNENRNIWSPLFLEAMRILNSPINGWVVIRNLNIQDHPEMMALFPRKNPAESPDERLNALKRRYELSGELEDLAAYANFADRFGEERADRIKRECVWPEILDLQEHPIEDRSMDAAIEEAVLLTGARERLITKSRAMNTNPSRYFYQLNMSVPHIISSIYRIAFINNSEQCHASRGDDEYSGSATFMEERDADEFMETMIYRFAPEDIFKVQRDGPRFVVSWSIPK